MRNKLVGSTRRAEKLDRFEMRGFTTQLFAARTNKAIMGICSTAWCKSRNPGVIPFWEVRAPIIEKAADIVGVSAAGRLALTSEKKHVERHAEKINNPPPPPLA